MVAHGLRTGEWVLLVYRLPREPSTPRTAVWRRLRRLGVAQLGDGLVALPADARTREQLDWVASEIQDAGGHATVWLAHPSSEAEERQVMRTLQDARTHEYAALRTEAMAALATLPQEQRRSLKSLRRRLHEIRRRDFFPPTARELAEAALTTLAAVVAEVGTPGASGVHVPGSPARVEP